MKKLLFCATLSTLQLSATTYVVTEQRSAPCVTISNALARKLMLDNLDRLMQRVEENLELAEAARKAAVINARRYFRIESLRDHYEEQEQKASQRIIQLKLELQRLQKRRKPLCDPQCIIVIKDPKPVVRIVT
ncbi:MAG TPA: hypothetical protein VLG71_01850 [Candidatus Limnocylindria bacterium]|nr:hypothetical protein [Candidatus Limnocylindria bacterium]